MPVVQMASEETPPPGKDNTKDKLVSMQPTVHKKTIGAQFSAVVGKNFKLKETTCCGLKTRGLMCCCTVVEIVVPVFFFGVMCLPKLFIPNEIYTNEFYNSFSLQDSTWAETNNWRDMLMSRLEEGRETKPQLSGSRLLASEYMLYYTPNSADASIIMQDVVRRLACHADDAGSTFMGDIFYQVAMVAPPPFQSLVAAAEPFMPPAPNVNETDQVDPTNDSGDPTAADTMKGNSTEIEESMSAQEEMAWMAVTTTCLVCSGPAYMNLTEQCNDVFSLFLKGFDDAEEAVRDALIPDNQKKVYATIVLNQTDTDDIEYTIKVNGTSLEWDDEGERFSADKFVRKWDAVEPNSYQAVYYGFLNIQNALDSAIMTFKLNGGTAESMVTSPVMINAYVKAFPWLEYTLNASGAIAGFFLPLLFIFAFISTTTLLMKSIVGEKELRLREGMQMMGLDSNMYWLSWFVSHVGTLFITMVCVTLVGMYPFEYTNAGLQFVFLCFWSIALVNWCYFLSCFFQRSQIASIAVSLLFVCSLAPAIAVDISYPNGNVGWVLVMLHPGCAVYFWGQVLAQWELGNLGVTGDTVNDSILDEFHFSANTVLGMTIFDAFLYALLAWYFDKVVPGQFGTTYPLWFPFTREYWEETGLLQKAQKSGAEGQDVEAGDPSSNDPNVEPLTADMERSAAIVVKNLRKTFGTVVAVDGLSFSFASDQVSCLLGHNGAGKTTTISMLSGMIPATSGHATVGGCNIMTEMHEIRQSLGVCPQFDILWPSLTVREHLQLYSKFQGIPESEQEEGIRKTVTDLGMPEKEHALVYTLSGGQKRKLSVSIAFLGNPKVVFLDEPTSGMDPHSRRMTWEMIRQHKRGRAIVLTTHFMDEADLLSDRIAIMSAGKLACLGTSVFLKNRFGLGYSITLVKKTDKVHDGPVLDLIRGHILGVQALSNVGTELSYKLPSDETSKFADMLDHLEGSLDKLQIQSYGISNTTLEEVFLSIAEGKSGPGMGHGSHPVGGNEAGSDPTTAKNGENAALKPKAANSDSKILQSTGQRKLQQFKALMMKRLINIRRDPYGILTQLVGPVIFVLIALSISSIQVPDENVTSYPSVDVNRNMVDNIEPSLAKSDNPGQSAAAYMENFKSIYGDTFEAEQQLLAPRSCYCLPDNENEDSRGTFNFVEEGEEVVQEDQTCAVVSDWDVDQSCETFIDNTVDWFLLGKMESYSSCLREEGSCDGLYINHYDQNERIFNHTLLVNPTALMSTPVAMNTANSALWNLLNGGRGSIRTVNHPMDDPLWEVKSSDRNTIQGLITAIFLGLGMSTVSASFSVFLVWERMNNAKHLQMVSGVDKLMFWVTSFLADMLAYMIPFIAIIICFAAFNVDEFSKNDGLSGITLLLLCFGFAAIPLAYICHFPFSTPMSSLVWQMAGYSFFTMGTLVAAVIMENFIDTASTRDVTDITKWAFRLLPHYAMCRGVFDISYNYNQVCTSPNCVKDVMDMDIVGWPCVFMLVEGVVFFLITLFIEYHEGVLRQTGQAAEMPSDQDKDVLEERNLVHDSAAMEGEVVVVKDLAKTYPNGHVAVYPLNFSVGMSECFGLLGINGAGKTSTFRMLTGEFTPSSGDALVKGRNGEKLSIIEQLDESRKVMGYCPQFDGIQPNMTGREQLEFYAMIRGVPSEDVKSTADELLKKMDLTKYADRQCGTYSGGNKRKLSVGIALVGDPPLVLLDEPSTGMDPEARRFMWDVISWKMHSTTWGICSSTMQNRCVVLTSHSMEECEALCHKVGIMVKGQFRCFGSIQHLKNRFSEGYNLDVNMKPELVDQVQSVILQKIPGAKLVESQGSLLKFRIGVENSLPQLFRILESVKSQDAIFTDYSITQTTLEQVFVRFAEENVDGSA